MISILQRHPEASTNKSRQKAEASKVKERENETMVFPLGDQPRKIIPATAISARYTTILKELGDENGVAPKYGVETMSLDPPMFKVTVSFRDITFEGTARTKKEAKHQASRQACEHFDQTHLRSASSPLY